MQDEPKTLNQERGSETDCVSGACQGLAARLGTYSITGERWRQPESFVSSGRGTVYHQKVPLRVCTPSTGERLAAQTLPSRTMATPISPEGGCWGRNRLLIEYAMDLLQECGFVTVSLACPWLTGCSLRLRDIRLNYCNVFQGRLARGNNGQRVPVERPRVMIPGMRLSRTLFLKEKSFVGICMVSTIYICLKRRWLGRFQKDGSQRSWKHRPPTRSS